MREAELDDVGWRVWLATVAAGYCSAPFGPHHREFWEWAWRVELGKSHPDAQAFIGVWARGGAKSTSAEVASAALGARGRRRYALYVCGTQEQADDHVANIGALLEGEAMADLYPAMADRAVGKFGNPRGWRRNRLRTASGFTVDAVGLDTASRGIKLEEMRPDLIVVDDIDREHDGPTVRRKKEETLAQALLPAGSSDVIVIAIQNMLHHDSIFARLCDGRADFLTRRVLSGPVPAVVDAEFVRNPTTNDVTVRGRPTWSGQSLAVCERMIALFGLRAFLKECQHAVKKKEGALWTDDVLNEYRLGREVLDDLADAVVATAVDPAVTANPDSDETGIVTGIRVENCPCGKATRKRPHALVVADRSGRLGVNAWAERAVRQVREWGGVVVGEVNQGGDLVATTVANAAAKLEEPVTFKPVRATRGKAVRAEPVVQHYEDGRVHHVGVHPDLEEQQTTWVPGEGDSPDRVDAVVWLITYLLGGKRKGGLIYEVDEPDDETPWDRVLAIQRGA